ncbi:dermonecrotic toxin domain-containing protein [Pseudomonas japonica]|uniref:dermonecrotic toxin domain-containing protein n=1 Tax=Pseudomonas japonica TaxID=256466 RepID=UPI0015E286E9|nr:DUF6543 domain-containing protein [Pseudomonas japonica]MBA1290865.1 hypothetical protein [Pseudomonas japonica]
MPDPYTAVSRSVPLHWLPGPVARRLADGPTLENAAMDLLGPALAAALPAQGANHTLPDTLALGHSLWRQEQRQLAFVGYQIQPLAAAILDRFIAGAPLPLSAEETFLTLERGSEYPARLAGDMNRVIEEIDVVSPFVVDAWCERWMEYWQAPDENGESPWAWMAAYLKERVNQAMGDSEAAGLLSASERAMVRVSLGLPPSAAPAAEPERGQVRLLRTVGESAPTLLVSGPATASACIAFSADTGFRRFPDAAAATRYFGDPLPVVGEAIVAGDPFSAWAVVILEDYLACALDKAEALRESSLDADTFSATMEATIPGWTLDNGHRLARRNTLKHQLPRWLTEASKSDRLRYALGLDALLAARRTTGDDGFLSGIPTAAQYARQRLIEQAAREHPLAPLADPDDVVVRIFTRTDDDLLSIAGGGGSIHLSEQQISLVDLSLLNTGGRPAGWMAISPREGKTIPAWLDDDSAIALVKAVDVGGAYLKLLHGALTTGEEAARRRHTFKAMVAAQVPLLALELRLKQECGFDEQGVTLVRRSFVPDNELPRPKVARLGLEAAIGLPPDIATGMFLLHQPEASDTVVLYAPLASQPLRQFQSRGKLMEAIMDEPQLRQMVLSWLSEMAQTRYRNGGLRAPHWLRFGQGDEFSPMPAITPATVTPVPVQGNPLDAFYEGVVDALTLAADRQTVSNQESFWISAREVGWLMFNQVTPFLSGPAATAGWLIQIGHALDEHFNGVGTVDTPPDAGVDELLFDIALALVSEASARTLGTPSSTGNVEMVTGHASPTALPERVVLEAGWGTATMALNAALRQRLHQLATPRPTDLPPQVPAGPLKGLLQDDRRWLAWIDGALFEVAPGNGEAVVLDPVSGEANGPWLRRDEAGRWRLDLRLRLRGGAPKRRIEQQRELNRQRRERARQCLSEIERTYRVVRAAGVEGDKAISAAISAGNTGAAHARRLEEAARVSQALDTCAGLREEYEGISAEVAMPERGKELTVALTAEANLCAYYLSLNRDLLMDQLNAAQVSAPAFQGDEVMQPAEVTAWFAFLHEYQDVADAGVRWRMRLDERMRKLGEIPVAGRAALAALEPKMATFRQLIEYRALSVYTELSLMEEPMLGDDSVRRSVHEAMKPLTLGLNTHKEMTLDTALAHGAALELLDGVIHTYQAAEDTLQWLRQTLRPEYVSSALDRLSEMLAALQADAEAWLGRLLREATAPTSAPAHPSAGAAHGGRRVIRTRTRGAVVARVRAKPEKPAEEIAEVVSPLDNTVVARFEQDPAHGDWVEQPPAAASPSNRGPHDDLERLAEEADRQLEGATRQLQQAPRLARVTRIPLELEELLTGSARNLADLADRIEGGLTHRNETDVAVEAWGSAERKARALRDMAARLITQGRTLRIRLTKAALPTAERVRYLVQEGEARVERSGSRVALKGQGKRKDLVQEYAIREPNGTVLWYAHFHYASLDAADSQYVAAHLKTVSQRFTGLQAQLAQAASDADVLKIYRSRIDPVAARELFLNRP